MPEIVDLLHEKYIKEGPYEVVIGYSMGGLGAGLTTAQLPSDQLPKDLILIAAPPYSSYFFKSTIIELGFRKAIYKGIFVRVEETYGTPITDLDIRHQQQAFEKTKLTFVYDENDQTIPFDIGIMLKNLYPQAQFIHTRGLGHYKIIAYDPINELLLKRIIPEGIPNY